MGIVFEVEEFFVDGLFAVDGSSAPVIVEFTLGIGDLVKTNSFCALEVFPGRAVILKVADVFPTLGSDGFDAGVAKVGGPEVFGEGMGSPVGVGIFEEREVGLALHVS